MKQLSKRRSASNAQDKINSSIMHLLLPSILGIILCFICLAGMSWAWFTASVSADAQTITAASTSAALTIRDNNGTEVEAHNGNYTLVKGCSYTVNITATGTASKMYCLISGGGTTYCTSAIENGGSLDITINVPDVDTVYTFTPVWQIPSGSVPIENSTIGKTVTASGTENSDTPPENGSVPDSGAAPETDIPSEGGVKPGETVNPGGENGDFPAEPGAPGTDVPGGSKGTPGTSGDVSNGDIPDNSQDDDITPGNSQVPDDKQVPHESGDISSQASEI